jgi:hypothetical protein
VTIRATVSFSRRTILCGVSSLLIRCNSVGTQPHCDSLKLFSSELSFPFAVRDAL